MKLVSASLDIIAVNQIVIDCVESYNQQTPNEYLVDKGSSQIREHAIMIHTLDL